MDVRAPAFVPSVTQTSSPIPHSDGDESDTDDPNMEYVRLRLRIDDLKQRNDKYRSNVEPQDLRARLEKVKKNYFFDEKDAELQYQSERQKADALALQARLRGINIDKVPPQPSHTSALKRRPPELLPSKAPVHSTVDIFEGDDEDSSPGLLEILENLPANETSNQGTTVTVRDMALPKHWAGHTPKKLLQETVYKTDRFAAISYRLVSGPSRVKRAAVTIVWEGGKTGDWIMEDVGCHDEGQAEQYVATLALHAVTFTPSEGFAGGVAASGGQTFFRLLPPVFRDLWDELEASRKATEDATNRDVWAKLRSIIEQKLGPAAKVCLLTCFQHPLSSAVLYIVFTAFREQDNQTSARSYAKRNYPLRPTRKRSEFGTDSGRISRAPS